MFIDKIPAKTKNGDFNVIIEIPMNDTPVKYEFDKDAGAIIVDRFMQVSMSYPCNYGFIPHTLSDDGDPADVLVIAQYPIVHGAVITVRPVGVLMMEDESGMDEKILAVPISKLDPTFESVKDIDDVPDMLKQRINHFFEHYKQLEKNKWVKIVGWENAAKAKETIEEAIIRAGN
ncbi:MAG: inorganic diphosphatase [Rickettsiaceae bacterium]|nr:inorganic diphosphatase [Rickettsiaceae bacterium]MDP4832957.1 inorganic diphosphatase [Rickettsiaceae bacterium]MDP5020900.1 inorganic diphosphatase [Rickettsiaceae bacterium]MDP5083519.1 inorganic diphosphatase [Rickettsiaceae bacterium]